MKRVRRTLLIGLAFAVVVLILAFGSVLAMGLPIAVAIGGVGIGVGSITLLSNVVDAPDFTPIIGMMIGLGVEPADFFEDRTSPHHPIIRLGNQVMMPGKARRTATVTTSAAIPLTMKSPASAEAGSKG